MSTDTRQKILSYITRHKKVRPHDLVQKFGLSHVAIHKQIKKLLTDGKITKIGTPPLVFYTTSDKKLALERIKEKALPILRQARVKKAAIFGSYARGDNTPNSDIDMLVDFPPHATLIDVVGLKQDLEEIFQKKVDVVSYGGIHPLLKESILSNQYQIL